MLGRVALGVFVLILMFAFGGTISNGIKVLRTDNVTQVASITTGGGQTLVRSQILSDFTLPMNDPLPTSGDIVLTRGLFGDELSNVISVTSDDSSDVPVASEYVTATQTLTITGLEMSQTRNITVHYYTEKADVFWSAVGPFLSFLVFGGIIAAIIYSIWKPSRR